MLPFSDVDRKKFPLGYKRLRYALLKGALSRSFREADAVIFISNYAKQVIDELLPKRAGTSAVIYHGIAEGYRRRASLPRPAGLPPEYVLYVSILNVYKCHLEVVEAWDRLRKLRPTPEKLVFAGPEFPPYAAKVRRKIQDLGLENEILLVGKVPYENLPAYYQNAKVNLFASTCENCPNILLEALAAATPVLSSDIQPMPEIAGGGARLFSPYSPDEIAEALRAVLDDPAEARSMSERAGIRSKDFSWQKTRAQTWNFLLSLA
jgi:glycosyltransferase involved in cell wall biosynthesis